jgi:copper chaperone NosL
MLAGCLLLGVAGCSADRGQGPVPVTWDRDACEHCRMILSDRHYAAEVRLKPGEQAHKFDDLGCALTWLAEQPGGIDAAAEIWVLNSGDGRWLDARSAHYLTGQATPMDYGLGAVAEASPGSIDFSQARQVVLTKERKAHTGHGQPRTQSEAPR